MKKIISKLVKAIRELISPPTWESLTEEQREHLLSLSRRKRKQLARAMVENTVVDSRSLRIGGGHSSGVDTGGAEGADAGGAMGNVLGDMRREMIREAMREGERNGR